MTLKKRRKRRDNVIAELKNGDTVITVCKRHKLSVSHVRNLGYESGLGLSLGISNERVKSFPVLAKLLNTKASQRAIARKFGISRQRVSEIYKDARAAGIRVPVRKRAPRKA